MSLTLKINEIFFSIQGESTHAGRPCAFVRLSGCPLRCTWCDTEYAFFEGTQKTFGEIFVELARFPTKLVEVTGGEPLAQPNCIPFMQELLDRGYEVLLETSGAFSTAAVPEAVKVILDVKAPGSSESKKHDFKNLDRLNPTRDEVKFVISDKRDFDYAVQVTREFKLFDRSKAVLLSPVHQTAKAPALSLKDLAEWILKSELPFRMQTQLHKQIWGAEQRGV